MSPFSGFSISADIRGWGDGEIEETLEHLLPEWVENGWASGEYGAACGEAVVDEIVVSESNGVKLHLSNKPGTGYIGVLAKKSNGQGVKTRHVKPFRVQAYEFGKSVCLGSFDSKVEAAIAYAKWHAAFEVLKAKAPDTQPVRQGRGAVTAQPAAVDEPEVVEATDGAVEGAVWGPVPAQPAVHTNVVTHAPRLPTGSTRRPHLHYRHHTASWRARRPRGRGGRHE